MKFNRLQTILEALSNYKYRIPENEKQTMLFDFYMLINLPIPIHNENLKQALDESRWTLMNYLKPHLLKFVFFSICAEFYHIEDKNSIEEIVDFFTKLKARNFINEFGKTFDNLNSDRRGYGKDDISKLKLTKRFEGEKQKHLISWKSIRNAMKKTRTSEIDFVKLAKEAYSHLSFNVDYGGEAWANICQAWIWLYEASPTNYMETMMAIDHVYHLQHNTSTVFTKIKSYQIDNTWDWIMESLEMRKDMKSLYEIYDNISPGLRILARHIIKAGTGNFGIGGETLESYMDKAKKIQIYGTTTASKIRAFHEKYPGAKGSHTDEYNKSDINNDNLPSWFKVNLDKGNISRDAVYKVEDNILIWEKGTWLGGTWIDGTWENGTWEYGIWNGGTWNGGTWNWKNGLIYDPDKKGKIKKAEDGKTLTWTGLYVNAPKGMSPAIYFGQATSPYTDSSANKGNSELPQWFTNNLKNGNISEDAVYTVNKVNTDILVWEYGTWKKGVWHYGIWEYGTWEDGTWEYGTWNGGTWEKGTWETGRWYDGTWKGGTWESGDWKGGWIFDPNKKGKEEYVETLEWDGDYVNAPKGMSPAIYFGQATSPYTDSSANKGNSELPQWFTNNLKNGNISEDAVYTVNNDILVWETGIWKNGAWHYGIWENGIWETGTWVGGLWKDGTWNGGTWWNGDWEGGWIFDINRKGKKEYVDSLEWNGDYVKAHKGLSPGEYFGQSTSPDIEPKINKDIKSSWVKDGLTKGNISISSDAAYTINKGILNWRKGRWYKGTWEDGTWGRGTWEGGTWIKGIWNSGYWEDGTWVYGTWENGWWYKGTWEDGTWEKGNWYNGTWKGGVWENGWWYNGTWKNGWWYDGTWKGGTWETGIWEGGTWNGGLIYDPDKKGKKQYVETLKWEWDDYVVAPKDISPAVYFGQPKSPYTK